MTYYAKLNERGAVTAVLQGAVADDSLVKISAEDYATVRAGGDYKMTGSKVVPDPEAAAIAASKVIPLTYKELRAAAYPPVTDFLDSVVKGDSVARQKYIDDCLAVKAKYPKPGQS